MVRKKIVITFSIIILMGAVLATTGVWPFDKANGDSLYAEDWNKAKSLTGMAILNKQTGDTLTANEWNELSKCLQNSGGTCNGYQLPSTVNSISNAYLDSAETFVGGLKSSCWGGCPSTSSLQNTWRDEVKHAENVLIPGKDLIYGRFYSEQTTYSGDTSYAISQMFRNKPRIEKILLGNKGSEDITESFKVSFYAIKDQDKSTFQDQATPSQILSRAGGMMIGEVPVNGLRAYTAKYVSVPWTPPGNLQVHKYVTVYGFIDTDNTVNEKYEDNNRAAYSSVVKS